MFFTYYKNFEEASLYHIQPPPPKKGIKSTHASFRLATYGVSINPSIIYIYVIRSIPFHFNVWLWAGRILKVMPLYDAMSLGKQTEAFYFACNMISGPILAAFKHSLFCDFRQQGELCVVL